jgi:hypothetical protein
MSITQGPPLSPRLSIAAYLRKKEISNAIILSDYSLRKHLTRKISASESAMEPLIQRLTPPQLAAKD